MEPTTPKRGRPRLNKIQNAVKAIEREDAAPVVTAAPTAAPAAADLDSASARLEMRTELRPPLREEDPRTRAARRAAEIRNNVGSMDDGVDDFRAPEAPPGWSYEWKRKLNLGAEDPAYQVELARKGWEPVPTSRHPAFMPDGGRHPIIERKGMVLMERPLELTEEARRIEIQKARNQVRSKEQQLNAAPDGQFGRDHEQVRAKINKSYEAIPIPKE
jgi:hypothetical protein